MKRRFLCMGVFAITCVYGAQKNNTTRTRVQLVKVPYLQYLDHKVDIVVAGKNQQSRLLGLPCDDISIGKVSTFADNTIYRPKKASVPAGSVAGLEKKNNNAFQCKFKYSKVMYVTEPHLGQELFRQDKDTYESAYVYETMRTKLRKSVLSATFEFTHAHALEEAKKDLGLCYSTMLDHYARADNKVAKIGFLPIGQGTGIPWRDTVKIAVDSIYNYIDKRPTDYNSIWLCVLVIGKNSYYEELYEYYKQLLHERSGRYTYKR